MADGQVWKREGKTRTTWYFCVDLPGNGKRRQLKRGGFRTRREAQEAMRAALAAPPPAPDRTTLAAFLETWFETIVAPRVTPSTLAGYRTQARNHLLPRLGDTRLGDLTPEQIQTLYADLRRHGRIDGRGGLSATAIRQIHAVLHGALEQAVRWERIPRNPAKLVDVAPPDTQERPSIAPELLQRLLVGAAQAKVEHWLYPAVLIAVSTGFRRGEVLGWLWSDIRTDRQPAYTLATRALIQPPTKDPLYFGPTKTKNPRPVALPDILMDELTAHRERQQFWKHRAAELWQGSWRHTLADLGGELVVSQEDGTPVRPSALTLAFGTLAARLGCPQLHFHDLRHCFISTLVAARLDLKTISKVAGHSSARITLDTYSHVTPANQAAVAAETDRALAEVIRQARAVTKR